MLTFMETLYSYHFGYDNLTRMHGVLKMFRYGFKELGGIRVENVSVREHGDAEGSAIEYRLEGGCSVQIIPDEKAPAIEVRIEVPSDSDPDAAGTERMLRKDIESIIYVDHGAAYCCE